MASQLRILLSAYACEPGKGSEPEVGWQWALGLARIASVSVLTRANNKPFIEAALLKEPGDERHRPQIIYYDLPAPFVALKKYGLPVKLYYLLWQIGVSARIFRIKQHFDIVQHLTFNAFSLPGFLWFRHPAVVLGPLGGGMVTKWRHLRWFPPESRVAEILRSLLVTLSSWSPTLWISCAFARLILVANEDTLQCIPRPFHFKTRGLLETACPPTAESGQSETRPLNRFIWIGRLEPRKAPTMAVEALERVLRQGERATLTVVGDGPLREPLKRMLARKNLTDAIELRGKMTREETLRTLGEYTALIFTSVRDTSGNVVLEAMAQGLPVIAFNHQGIPEMLDGSCGYLVETVDDSNEAEDFARSIIEVIRHPDIAAAKGRAAHDKARGVLSWENKWRTLLPLYQNLCEKETKC
jgi:glycosyltransferase involved in cell wall biosynthesis